MDFPTKEQFRAWLKTLPPDHVVAPESYSSYCCPIATFMLAQGFDAPYIFPSPFSVWSCYNQDGLHPLPNWANAFATKVDMWAKKNSDVTLRFTAITAKRALLLLRGIKD